jgi:hypothetical protein
LVTAFITERGVVRPPFEFADSRLVSDLIEEDRDVITVA